MLKIKMHVSFPSGKFCRKQGNLNLFQRAAKTISPSSIICHGCGDGKEIDALLKAFPSATKIVGIETCDRYIQTLTERFHDHPIVNINCHLPEDKYDLSVCCNVLFSKKEGDTINIDQFQAAILELWNITNVNGGLIVSGSNWNVADIIPDVPRTVIWGNSGGKVVCYTMNNVLIPHNENPVYLYRKTIKEKEEQKSSHDPLDANNIENDIESLWKNPNVISGKRRINIGILSVAHGTNVGDFSQCLAAVNVWSRFYRPSWHIESPELREALEYFSRTKPSGPCTRAKNYDADVHMYFIDRDTTHVQPNPAEDNGIIYVIANGWYMTKGGGEDYQLPLSPWIHPFIVSMHLHKPEALEQVGVVQWMNKFGPVGCRDTDTERLFRSYQVDCYYSQCLTTTLEMPFSSLTDESRSQVFRVDQNKRFDCADDNRNFSHLQPDFMNTATPGEVMKHMLTLLREYVQSEHLATTRIHAVMPAKAMGAQSVQFCSPVQSNSSSWNSRSRFSGLLEGFETPAKREILALLMFERLTQVLDNLFVNAFTSEQLQQAWKGQLTPEPFLEPKEVLDLHNIDGADMPYSWSAARKLHPSKVVTKIGGIFETFSTHPAMHHLRRRTCVDDPTKIIYWLRTVPNHSFDRHINFVVCFDTNYIQYFHIWMLNLSKHHPDTLCRVFCVTRDVSSDAFQEVQFEAAHFGNIVLFQIESHEKFERFQTTLGHTNRCVLDRLFLTEQPYNVDDEIERVIYLDIDIHVAGNLNYMTEMCTGQMGLGAKSSKIRGVVKKWIKKSGCKSVKYHSDKGFNAGVLVADLSKLRWNNFWKKMCTLFIQTNGLNDQIILTIFSEGRYAELKPQYNIFVSQDDSDYTYVQGQKNSGKLFHFVGSHKPYIMDHDTYINKSSEKRPYNSRHWKMWENARTVFHSLNDRTRHFVYA
jgi:lipopolysaccharide biosynthesis glycosyltransferase